MIMGVSIPLDEKSPAGINWSLNDTGGKKNDV